MLPRLALTLLLLGPVSSVNLSAEGVGRRAAAEKTFHAERFDVRAELARDRSLRVEETVTFVFTDGTFTRVWRDIPTRYTDGIVDVSARLDGVVLPEGTGPSHVEIVRGSTVKATWHLAPTTGTHTFSLSYRLLGLAMRGSTHDQVDWIALPSKHGYRVDTARVSLRVPAGAAILPADVRPRLAEALAGPDGVSVTARNLGPDATIRIAFGVSSAAMAAEPPHWQLAQLERARRGPWMLLVAGTILVAGLGWLAAFAAGWAQPPRPNAAARVAAPPDPDLPAAIAARLAGRGSRLSRVTATVLELADRGVIRVEERPMVSRMLGRNYDVILAAAPASVEPHEAAALALAFGRATEPGARTSWRRLQQNINNKGLRFGRALLESMQRYGYVDFDRVAARSTLGRVVALVWFLVLAAVAVAAALLSSFGPWVFFLPAAVAIVAIAMSIVLGRFSVLTARGEADARAWRSFFSHFSSLVSPKQSASTVPSPWLPVAVAMGIGRRAVKRIAARTPLPAWFHTAAGADGGRESFVALLASTEVPMAAGSADGGASAAAAAGAAGGGASGAS